MLQPPPRFVLFQSDCSFALRAAEAAVEHVSLKGCCVEARVSADKGRELLLPPSQFWDSHVRLWVCKGPVRGMTNTSFIILSLPLHLSLRTHFPPLHTSVLVLCYSVFIIPWCIIDVSTQLQVSIPTFQGIIKSPNAKTLTKSVPRLFHCLEYVSWVWNIMSNFWISPQEQVKKCTQYPKVISDISHRVDPSLKYNLCCNNMQKRKL